MTPDDIHSATDADELIAQLVTGNREVLDDAQDITSTDGLQAVEVIHEAANDEQVILHYNFFATYKSTGEASMGEIDIFAPTTDDERDE